MIKKLALISCFSVMGIGFMQAQTTVFAYVKDNLNKPIESAEIDLRDSENDVSADKIGYFQFVDLLPGNYEITISKPYYEAKTLRFSVSSGEKKKDLGVINLTLSAASNNDLGVVILDDASAEDDQSSMQPTVGLLNSGRDAFASAAAFELGAYWFRPRGNDNRYAEILFNGVPMSKNDDGRIDFSNWGGLNDVTRYPYENAENIAPSEFAFGNLGGVTYYNTRASSFRKGVSLAYSLTNRSYFHRAMATYNTGLLKNGWAFSLSASRRWAEDGIIDGTYQDSYAYFAAIEKRFGDKHALNLTAFGAPTYRASNSPNTQEVYDLLGKDYNSYWGWQDGEKRNERIRKSFEPVFQLTHYWKLGNKSKITNTFSYQFGSDRRGRLDWFNASNPNPTYYANMPSDVFKEATYLDSPGSYNITQDEYDTYLPFYQQKVEAWKNGSIERQINWNDLYSSNYKRNQYGASAAYYTVQDVNDDKTFNYSGHFDTMLAENWKLNFNFNYQNLESDNYRRLNDLLGANFASNSDDFDGSALGTYGSYNVDATDNRVFEGQRMEYNYLLKRESYVANLSTNINLNRWNVTASIFGGYKESYRDGKYRHYLYLDNSKGKSDVYDAFEAGLKARVEFRIDGKNFIVYDGTYFSLSPTLNEIFANARLNNTITPYLKNQIINSNDLSFIHRGQILKLRLSGYYTDLQNSTEISRYYAEGIATVNTDTNTTVSSNIFVSEILSNARKEYLGGELGIDVKVTPTFNIIAAGSLGQYIFKNNPELYLFSDDVKGVQSLGKAYMKNYKVAGTPQKAATLGFKYNSPKFWWLGVSGNYLADNYLDISALPRTTNFIYYPGSQILYNGVTEQNVRTLLKQQKFENQFMLNANAGKSFRFGKYRVGASVSVNNILNNRNYVTGGFEQARNSNFESAISDYNRPTPIFDSKLWYDRGRTYFANVYLRF